MKTYEVTLSVKANSIEGLFERLKLKKGDEVLRIILENNENNHEKETKPIGFSKES